MQRSRVTVEYSHLPGQIFEHEAGSVFCVTAGIEGRSPRDLKVPTVLEALENALDLWAENGGVHAGYPTPVTEHEDQFQLVVPRLVEFDIWPTIMFCNNRSCGHIIEARRPSDLPAKRKCPECNYVGRYVQLPYFQVHSCGRKQELALAPCDEHQYRSLAFEDSGSFHTARFRCLVCRRPLDMQFRRCPCRLAWNPPDPGELALLPVTARDSRAFFGHHLTMVPIGGTKLTDALRAQKGVHYALGHYIGTITDLGGLEEEAAGRRHTSAAAEENSAVIRELRERYPDLPEAMLGKLTAMADSGRGDEPALEATEKLLSADTIANAKLDRRMMERAFLFAECAVDGLDLIAESMAGAGHTSLSTRLKNGLAAARQNGLSDISVVRDFPIALVGFGFTREYPDPRRARLAPLSQSVGDDSKIPLVTVEARTEGLLVELDPVLLWKWCSNNGWCQPPPIGVKAQEARGWLLDQTYTEPQNDAATGIRRVTHAYGHLLMHALANHSSYSSNSVAEYLLERQASTLIYVAKYTSFNLGGLAALAEQHLKLWIEDATTSAWTCVHDPICLSERGGCHKCIAVAFGCERFNRGLDRSYLVGGGPNDIAEGYLFTAGAAQISK